MTIPTATAMAKKHWRKFTKAASLCRRQNSRAGQQLEMSHQKYVRLQKVVLGCVWI